MFEKCGFSEENTMWASISYRRARMDTKTRKFKLLARYARRNLNYPN